MSTESAIERQAQIYSDTVARQERKAFDGGFLRKSFSERMKSGFRRGIFTLLGVATFLQLSTAQAQQLHVQQQTSPDAAADTVAVRALDRAKGIVQQINELKRQKRYDEALIEAKLLVDFGDKVQDGAIMAVGYNQMKAICLEQCVQSILDHKFGDANHRLQALKGWAEKDSDNTMASSIAYIQERFSELTGKQFSASGKESLLGSGNSFDVTFEAKGMTAEKGSDLVYQVTITYKNQYNWKESNESAKRWAITRAMRLLQSNYPRSFNPKDAHQEVHEDGAGGTVTVSVRIA